MATQEKVKKILKEAAENSNISNYELFLDEDSQKGDGFLSEFHTGKVLDKNTGESIEIYIKVPPRNFNAGLIPDVYNNEIIYYLNIYPELDRFQREKGVKEPFKQIPICYCGRTEPDDQYLALENLKVKDYVLFDKTKFIDETHLKRLFQTYGRYHALSFAFKEQNPEKYEELVKPLKNVFRKVLIEDRDLEFAKQTMQAAQIVIKEENELKAAKLTPIIHNLVEFLSRGLDYYGKYSTLVHGDCWSNNIMFKYNKKGEIENLKLLDHQLTYDSTPVHDLSYFFYSGASKKDFDKLDDYLELYYKSFSSFARELGSNPEKLFPFEALKSDWKKYSLLGMNMGLMVWQIKLMAKDKIQSLSDENAMDIFKENSERLLKSDTFKRNVSNILLHAIEYGII